MSATPRLCASQHKGEAEPTIETCRPQCTNQTCTQCRCRACAICRCTDLNGYKLVEPLCSYANNFHTDIDLGRLSSGAACQASCSQWVGAPSSCVAWTFSTRSGKWYAWLGFATCRIIPIRLPPVHRPNTRAAFLLPRSIGHTNHPHFITGWEPDGILHGVAHCAAAEWPSRVAPPPLVLLITIGSFACHGAALNRLVRSRMQIESSSQNVFRVLQISRDDAGSHSDEDTNATVALRAAVGEEVVDRIGLPEIKQAFPNILQQMRKIKWLDRRKPLWLSNGCDLPILAWFAKGRMELPRAARHLWVLQHDVGWTNVLPTILHNFGSAPELYGADLICDDPTRMPRDWFHYDERWPLDADAPVFSCLLPALRISVRLIHQLVEQVAAGNATSYCEIRAATACATTQWCTMASIRMGGSSLLGPFSHFTRVPERFLAPASPRNVPPFVAATRSPEPCIGRLMHQVV